MFSAKAIVPKSLSTPPPPPSSVLPPPPPPPPISSTATSPPPTNKDNEVIEEIPRTARASADAKDKYPIPKTPEEVFIVLLKLDSCMAQYEYNPKKVLQSQDFFDLLSAYLNIFNGVPIELSESEKNELLSIFGVLVASAPVLEQLIKFVYYFLSTKEKINSLSLYGLELVITSFHNFADKSIHFCRTLTVSSTFRKLYSELLPSWFEDHNKKSLPPSYNKIIRGLLSCISNSYYKNDTIVNRNLSEHDFASAAKLYLKSTDDLTKFIASLVVIFIVDDNDINNPDFYFTDKSNIYILIQVLVDSLKSPTRLGFYEDYSYHVTEAVRYLDRLAKHDSNKTLLIELQILPILNSMLSSPRADEILGALDLLFTLSFNERNIVPIRSEISTKLHDLWNDDRIKNSKAFRGLSFVINKVENTPVSITRKKRIRSPMESSALLSSRSVSQNSGHIMISYQHEIKDLVTKIKHELVNKHKMQVWIDYEQMVSGSTMDAMAEAVEKASVVLLCMSHKYKESNNCRLEGEYAAKVGKHLIPLRMESNYRATGWLGIIIGSSLYQDFSGKYPFETKLEDLVKAIKTVTNFVEEIEKVESIGVDVPIPPRITTYTPPKLEHHFPTKPSLPPIGIAAIRNWTKEDVLKWCNEKKLSTEISKLNLTGQQLYFLLTAKKTAPESFYRFAEKYCSDLSVFAEFSNAVCDLADKV